VRHNVGGVDRIVRFVVGTGLLLTVVFLDVVPLIAALLWAGAAIALATAAISFCPLNYLMGINTYRGA